MAATLTAATLPAFVKEQGITLASTWIAPVVSWTPTTQSFRCTLALPDGRTTPAFTWSHGGGLQDFGAVDVLDSLIGDASTGEQYDTARELAQDFGADYGTEWNHGEDYDEYNRIFAACKATAIWLREWLGDEAYEYVTSEAVERY